MFPQLDDEATRKAYYKEFRKVRGLFEALQGGYQSSPISSPLLFSLTEVEDFSFTGLCNCYRVLCLPLSLALCPAGSGILGCDSGSSGRQGPAGLPLLPDGGDCPAGTGQQEAGPGLEQDWWVLRSIG